MVISNGISPSRLKYLIWHCYYNIVMQILDGLFTFWGTFNFGAIAEGNPIIRYFIENYGLISILWIKGFVILLLGVMILAIRISKDLQESPSLGGVLTFINVLYTIVVGIWVYAYFNPHLIAGFN